MNIQIQGGKTVNQGGKGVALLALGFRPFFLVAGLFAVLLMVTFLLGLMTGVWHYNLFPLSLWHAHEMIFGYSAAVVAGFLLTAVRNWTGMDTATGGVLLLLLLLWLAGRLAPAMPMLPGWVIALMDISFLPLLAAIILRPILKARQYRNLSVPLVLLLMAIGQVLMYGEILEFSFGSLERGMMLGLGSMLILISVIGGRVMPFFTERGLPGVMVIKRGWVEHASTPIIAIWLALELIGANGEMVMVAALTAAVIHGIRLAGWWSGRIWSEPMIWIIHLAYAWLVAGFLLQMVAVMDLMPLTVALHGWTAGAIGLFTLGMMARVSLGHTGRAVRATPIMTMAFVLMALVAPIRVVLPLLFPSLAEVMLVIAASGWIMAFLIFTWVYVPYLVRPRADGQVG